METDTDHGNPHGQDTQEKKRCVACKGLPDHLFGQQVKKVGKGRHQNPYQSDGQGLCSEIDDRHGDHAQHQFHFPGGLLHIVCHMPLNHLFSESVFPYQVDHALGGRNQKTNNDKEHGTCNNPEQLVGKQTFLFCLDISHMTGIHLLFLPDLAQLNSFTDQIEHIR